MIIGLGCVAYDRIVFTNALWEDGKGRIQRTETRFGGNVRNALTAAAGLGSSAGYLATVSSAPEWDSVLADLADHNVSAEFTVRSPGAHPALATIIVTRDGDRFIAYDDSSLANTPLPPSEVVGAALMAASVLMVDASTAPPGSLDVITDARDRGVPVVLDAEREAPGSDIVERMIEVVDHPILPLNYARLLTGKHEPEAIIDALWSDARSALVITDGAQGVYVRAHDLPTTVRVPAFDVVAVDTVGCGDVFHGAYATGLDRGLEAIERVRLANAAAAVVAAAPSGSSRVPGMPAVAEILATTPS